jgi:NTP pyrophosphatase (non-canonical NTP hydrolase)
MIIEIDFLELNSMRDAVHELAREKGWYDDPETDGQFITRAVANLHSEVSELWEAYRGNKLDAPCDKADKMIAAGIDPLTCKEEELADIIIRALDDAARLNVNIARAVCLKHHFNKTRDTRHGGKAA